MTPLEIFMAFIIIIGVIGLGTLLIAIVKGFG